MNKGTRYALIVLGLSITCTAFGGDAANPYIGRWALTIPGGAAGWLGVTQEKGYLDASLLWGGGSVLPVDSVFTSDDSLIVVRLNKVERKDASGKVVRTQTFPNVLMARVSGDDLELMQIEAHRNGVGIEQQQFAGKRIPPLPPKPDLSNVKFGKPITLFNGTNLDGWKLIGPDAKNGWSVENGILVNKPAEKGGHYGNLRTVAEFEDFNLKLEVNVAKGENSGVYLRGIYEVQVADTVNRGLDSHNMGGIYSRITPTVNAEKPNGQWQTHDLTLVDRHATVVLNGQKIIDNQPLLGCTGGALSSDELKPGPIYLQGDHTGIKYRNIVLTPVVK